MYSKNYHRIRHLRVKDVIGDVLALIISAMVAVALLIAVLFWYVSNNYDLIP